MTPIQAAPATQAAIEQAKNLGQSPLEVLHLFVHEVLPYLLIAIAVLLGLFVVMLMYGWYFSGVVKRQHEQEKRTREQVRQTVGR